VLIEARAPAQQLDDSLAMPTWCLTVEPVPRYGVKAIKMGNPHRGVQQSGAVPGGG